jgi:hypothetical protein
MSEMEVVRGVARRVLTGPTECGAADSWLWERAERVLRNVERISRMPELVTADAAIDRFCLRAAAYLSDAGYVSHNGCRDVCSSTVLSDVNPVVLREKSAKVAGEKLGGLLPAVKIDKIARIIVESARRDAGIVEAKILSDARNLDDIGAVAVMSELRRFILQGRGVADVLKSWDRKIDYHYWHGRLKDGFFFDTAQTLAVRRFASAKSFMEQVGIENLARDVEDMTVESVEGLAGASV